METGGPGKLECKAIKGKCAEEVPEHLQALEVSCQLLLCPQQQEAMAKLLREYQDVFSKGEHDVGLTNEVQHDIPVLPGTVPVKQPFHRLGPEKEDEVKKQAHSLLEKGMIEPAS